MKFWVWLILAYVVIGMVTVAFPMLKAGFALPQGIDAWLGLGADALLNPLRFVLNYLKMVNI